jgi:hypothetical protein
MIAARKPDEKPQSICKHYVCPPRPLVTKLLLGNAVQEAPASLALGKLELPDCGSQAGAWEPGEKPQS